MSQSFTFKITGEEAGQRLDAFLASRFGGLSRLRIAGLIAQGAAVVNSGPARPGHRIRAGDLVEVAMGQQAPTAMDPEPVPLDILYEDEQIVVVDKPAGMLVHPTLSVKSGTLANALAYHLNRSFYKSADEARPPAPGEAHSLIRPGLVHRLDRATSGLMVIAKTARAHSQLARHFRKRLIEKRYLALVRGALDKDSGAIIAPIGRDDQRRPRWWVTEGGKPAETRFRKVESVGGLTLVELEPVTGRTNQLRIHCAYAGHAILGDEIYSGSNSPISDLKSQNLKAPARLCLHACRLAFHHPSTGERVEFASPLPAEIAAFVALLRRQ